MMMMMMVCVIMLRWWLLVLRWCVGGKRDWRLDWRLDRTGQDRERKDWNVMDPNGEGKKARMKDRVCE